MKKNNVKIGNLVLKLGFPCKMPEYPIVTAKLGQRGSLVEVKICEIVRVDARSYYSRISLRDGSFIDDYRSVAEVALLLPYNQFGYYRKGCIFNMNCVKSIDIKAMKVVLDNSTEVQLETRTVFKRFDEDYYVLKR